jgi:parallel beta-helix repeat protein
MPRITRHVLLMILAATLWAGGGALVSAKTIVVATTIQAAVDAASPGDTIRVPPGIYHETVRVTTDHLTIRGSTDAILDATGFARGIRVGTGHFRLTHTQYRNNGEYGPFPVCSRHGVIAFNAASGHNDAAIYVGDDEDVVVQHNHVTRSTIGVEIENSGATVVEANTLEGNTAGILVVVLPGLPMPFTQDVRILHNLVLRNNRPNPVPADSGDPVGLLPTGTGILNIGGDQVVIRENIVSGNDTVGIAIIANPFAAEDPRIEPLPDHNRVRANVVRGNGQHPDPLRATVPGADLVYDGSGTDNCFAGNVFGTQFPEEVTTAFTCP